MSWPGACGRCSAPPAREVWGLLVTWLSVVLPVGRMTCVQGGASCGHARPTPGQGSQTTIEQGQRDTPCMCPTDGQPQRHNHPGQPAAHTGRLRDRHTPRHLTPPHPPQKTLGAQIGLALEPGPHSQRSTEAGTQGWLLQSLAGSQAGPPTRHPTTPVPWVLQTLKLWQLNPGRTDWPGPGAGAPAPPGGECRPGRQHPPQRPAHGGGP